MSVVLQARCRIFDPKYRIIRAQFDVDKRKDQFTEYVVTNLLRERGELLDARFYEITFKLLD
jgi:hypothetical protein